MKNECIEIPQMLLIGATGRNMGKTTLATAIIKKFKDNFCVIGLKVTTIREKNGKCPRGGEGCGVCSSLKGNFQLLEEVNSNTNKDTACLLKAGADRVFWLKTLKSYSYEAIKYFITQLPKNTLVICESNSIRHVVRPGGFIMVNREGVSAIKKSAREVIDYADYIVKYDFENNISEIVKKVDVFRRVNNIEVKIRES
ncbi:hypothetical protein BJV85_001880 [Clostridium acetobutylicum]|uniref:Uncharacterized protein n=1 Tax=Clostridium acetobutylicum (strain ATCC 824 / DSM 792 / JCM 1419 / IAM 19013 / LMG 5710 / NBRC 13948 / NRRL B-527 / VKM B-1787 / 2291 / W) TaxID=272562 RepID=Q97HL5_CLOAB|nr:MULTISPECIES: hypothetical protein [Clostridium]AAK79955.1 Hypothetical protein CA_C1996 [Clostridium acetobutylicum ATCC 824]ADZ21048.1 Conserved hypothetical protein [Clostridium acetobutylicum EA 2018]AEI32119.1 hypothetical protein SMB_G2028 [Clostridium acetobutylicum DSM 1731]AWV79613.1 hypothetical protein DK921_05760 [Clostridium acetobutylicum]MBC2394413.1 hypothetical protein [Clostridium acetobutylicum]